MKTTKKLIEFAKSNVAEIVEKSRSAVRGRICTVVYYGDNGGIIVGLISANHNTCGPSLWFGSEPLTKKDILEIIDYEEQW